MQRYLKAGSSWQALWHCPGGGEGLLDDEGVAAPHRVARDHPEVVGRVLLQPSDLDGRQGTGAHLLPRLFADLPPLDDVLQHPGAAVALGEVPPQLHAFVVVAPFHVGRALRRTRLVCGRKKKVFKCPLKNEKRADCTTPNFNAGFLGGTGPGLFMCMLRAR